MESDFFPYFPMVVGSILFFHSRYAMAHLNLAAECRNDLPWKLGRSLFPAVLPDILDPQGSGSQASKGLDMSPQEIFTPYRRL